ncbi:hypothetical protein C8255_02660 [filamentous cyanobacterium CCP3]|nr:hypothetical protein C8255_02660 [filamentous cyanobacterium CCP3]
MIQPTLLKKLEVLPESLQTEVLHYVEFLLERHLRNRTSNLLEIQQELQQELQQITPEEAEKRYGYGSLKGQIIMSDDFDEPLEDLAEYM